MNCNKHSKWANICKKNQLKPSLKLSSINTAYYNANNIFECYLLEIMLLNPNSPTPYKWSLEGTTGLS